MGTYKQIIDTQGKIIFGDFPQELKTLPSKITEKSIKMKVSIDQRDVDSRCGFEENSNGIIYVLTTESKYINSSKLFKELIQMSIIILDSIVNFKKNLSLNQNEYVQDLIHNLTSLNTYNILDLENLIPHNVLSQNINRQKETIKEIISTKPNISAETILKLIKYNFAMKVEFSVFEKTVLLNPIVQKIDHSIKEAILSILQIFIDDFEKKNIQVFVDSNSKRLHFDYDILFVSLFYIFENSIKYCCENSDFKVIFKEVSDNLFLVKFEMLSLRIEDYEVNKICLKKFRAKSALILTDKGKGIGMHRVMKTLKLNNIELEIIPRVSSKSKTIKESTYELNQFILKFDPTRII